MNSTSLALPSPFFLGAEFCVGESDEARKISDSKHQALTEYIRGRALPSFLSALSPESAFVVQAKWENPSEEMFEFLAERFPGDLLNLISQNALMPPAMTFAAEIAGRIRDSVAVRASLMPLLEHTNPLVREGAIYGLRDHSDNKVVERLEKMVREDPSPAIRQSASDTLGELCENR